MPNFKKFSHAVNKKFQSLGSKVFVVNVPKETIWEVYQNSIPAANNQVFRERRAHECNTCKSFMNRIGNVVSINPDGSLDSIWNVTGVEEPYATVAKNLHALVTSAAISGIFVTSEYLAGKEYNIEPNAAGDITWNHFYADISAFNIANGPTVAGDASTTASLFKRALDEFSISDLDTVIDLCDSIYRGSEFLPTVKKFKEAKIAYEASNNKANFIWANYSNYPSRIRNSAIGTLIIDIASGTDLEAAVSSYEKVVAPENYKRTTAVVTEGMKKAALATIQEQGLEDSLPRRHAKLEDVSINNVIWANPSAQKVMKGVAYLLGTAVASKVPTKSNEISIDDFIAKVLPSAAVVEALVENRHQSNFVSLVAPVNHSAPNMLKWDNNFSWSYAGEVTDSIKENVAKAGGSVTGVMRCSLQWNEAFNDQSNDLDLHCNAPNGHIFFGNKQSSGGVLDVDIQRPGSKVAVENITWANKPMDGTYEFYVNNYSGTNKDGFKAQFEFNGEVFDYEYSSSVRTNVSILKVTIKNGKATFDHKLKEANSQRQIWDISTLTYKPVTTIMYSPNYWDDNKVGNKHIFFMLADCKNPDDVRGFYNEFLKTDLIPHRKVFETLSSLMKVPYEDSQLSGLGFSSTIRKDLHVKVDGKPYKILF